MPHAPSAAPCWPDQCTSGPAGPAKRWSQTYTTHLNLWVPLEQTKPVLQALLSAKISHTSILCWYSGRRCKLSSDRRYLRSLNSFCKLHVGTDLLELWVPKKKRVSSPLNSSPPKNAHGQVFPTATTSRSRNGHNSKRNYTTLSRFC